MQLQNGQFTTMKFRFVNTKLLLLNGIPLKETVETKLAKHDRYAAN